MTYKTGANISIAHGTGSTFGTPDTIGAGDKLIVDSFGFNKNPEELTETGIGSGADMAADAQQGATTPKINITKTAYYNDAGCQAIANFFQGESIVGAANGYTHSFVHGGFNQKFLTTCATYAASSVLEAASGAVTSLSMSFTNPPNYAKLSYEILANDILYTGTTNSYATVEAASISNMKKIFARPGNTVTLSGSVIPVTDIEINLTKEQASPREMRNATGNGVGLATGDPPFQGTVTLTLAKLEDYTYFTAALNDSVFTLKTQHLSDTYITAANVNYYTMEWRFPALKLIQEPSADISDGGANPLQLKFKCVLATSVPAGMYSLYPHCVLINDKSTLYFT